MRPRSKWIALVVCVAAAGTVAVQVVAGPTGESSAAFNPKSLTGKWSGNWKNTTFGSTGSIRATVRLKNGKLKPTIQFGGNVFGCAAPPPAIFTLSKGNGNNQYNAGGLKVKRTTEAFGKTVGTYKHSTNKISGSGAEPPCRPQLKWKLTGKLTSSKFTGTVTITLEDGSKATAKLTAKKL